MLIVRIFSMFIFFIISSIWMHQKNDKIIRTDLIFLFIAILAAIIPVDSLISILTPVVVWLATAFVNWIKSLISNDTGIMGSLLTTVIVPLLSLGAAAIGNAIQPDLNFWTLFGLGLLSVFVNELIKQWSQSAKSTQQPAEKKLIG